MTPPCTFVLVHGAWHGGWCWRRVADRLRRDGHQVFTPTLTGVGERAHLIGCDISLATHVADVVNVITSEDLQDVVLCGHSYGGFVISGVAEQAESRIAALVFLDAFVPQNGEAMADIASPTTRDAIAATGAASTRSRPSRPPSSGSTRPIAPGWTATARRIPSPPWLRGSC